MKILIIHGPQLSLLGRVSSQNNSKLTLDKLNKHIRIFANKMDLEIKIFHHFSQKEIIKSLISNRNEIDGIIMNIGGMGRDAYALKEILGVNQIPLVEVALSEYPFSEENFNNSVLKDIAEKRIYKNSLNAYEEALEFFYNK